jgi:hypothetical protein
VNLPAIKCWAFRFSFSREGLELIKTVLEGPSRAEPDLILIISLAIKNSFWKKNDQKNRPICFFLPSNDFPKQGFCPRADKEKYLG